MQIGDFETNHIYNMDCIQGMRTFPDGCIDLVCTDPPYNISYKSGVRPKDHKFAHEILNDSNAEPLLRDYFKELYRIMKDDTAAYIFCSPKTIDFFLSETRKVGFNFKNLIVWDKGSGGKGDLEAQFMQSYEFILLLNKGRRKFNGRREGDIWHCNKIPAESLVHQNQKPVSLIRHCLEKHSERGDVVFDGFMGSGTTACACAIDKRQFIGFELDPHYYEVALKRIKITMSQPTLF